MTDPDIILRAAFAQHQASALPAACDLYRQVLDLRPGDHDALHLLGVARGSLGETTEAVALIRQAITVNPSAPSPHFNLGRQLLAQGQTEPALQEFLACVALSPTHVAALAATARTLHALGRSAEAVDHYARALTLTPADPILWTDLAATLTASGRLEEALRSYDQTLRLQPSNAENHYNRGRILSRQRAFEAAEAAFGEALAIRPDHQAALLNLGFAQEAQARARDAITTFERLLALDPDNLAAQLQRGLLLSALNRHADAVDSLTRVLDATPDHVVALAGRGGAFWMLEDWDQARVDLDRALQLDPNNVPALIDRGNVSHDQQQYDAAVAWYDRALALNPDNLTALMNRGGALQSLQRHADALETYRKALIVRPGHDDALMNIALCQLRAGQWGEGWQGYETRWCLPQWSRALPDFIQPLWDGTSDLHGKQVLLPSEQGLGDTIQFSRFARLLADRGAIVTLGVQQPLARLMRKVAGVSAVAVRDEPPPDHDLYIPLMSLPAILKLGQDVATEGPYLRAEAVAVSRWRTRLAALPGLKVGLAWAGDSRRYDRSAFLMDGRRSIEVDRLASLFTVDGVTFVSLQKGKTARPPLIDWTSELEDFADTAALIEALDLVISVDTAVAHLAGALGRPVWTLHRFDRCWRWMWDRTDTPWYPTMRLFTQTTPGAWDDVVSDVAEALATRAHQSANGTDQAS